MIISTSSHNVRLTDGIHGYVEDTIRSMFASHSGDVSSVDVCLAAGPGCGDRGSVKAVVRTSLNNQRTSVTEIAEDDVCAAIERGVDESRRAIAGILRHSADSVAQPGPGNSTTFSRWSAVNI